MIEHFGGVSRTARALGLAQSSVSEWKTEGIPECRQYQIELATHGKIRADKPALREEAHEPTLADRGSQNLLCRKACNLLLCCRPPVRGRPFLRVKMEKITERVYLHLTESMKRDLQDLALREDRKVSDLVRHIVCCYLYGHQHNCSGQPVNDAISGE